MQPFTLYLLTADRMTRRHEEADDDRRALRVPPEAGRALEVPAQPSRRRQISTALRRALAGPVGA